MLAITEDIAAIVRGIIAHPEEVTRRYALADAIEEMGTADSLVYADAIRSQKPETGYIEVILDSYALHIDKQNYDEYEFNGLVDKVFTRRVKDRFNLLFHDGKKPVLETDAMCYIEPCSSPAPYEDRLFPELFIYNKSRITARKELPHQTQTAPIS